MYTFEERKQIREAYKKWRPYTSPYSYFDWRFSPAESKFWYDIRTTCPAILYPEFPVLNYFIDFADPVRKVGFEVDGRDYHSSPEQIKKDRERQKRVEAEGWEIIRIPASAVQKDFYALQEEYRLKIEEAEYEGDYEKVESLEIELRAEERKTGKYQLIILMERIYD